MLKTNQIIKSTFWAIAALYLGYAFFNLFLSSFMAASMMAPSVLLLTTGFFFVMRWLGAEDTAPTHLPSKTSKAQRMKTGIFAPDQQHVFRVRKNKANCRRACMVNHKAVG